MDTGEQILALREPRGQRPRRPESRVQLCAPGSVPAGDIRGRSGVRQNQGGLRTGVSNRSVRDYYEGNTRSFLRPWRSSSSTGAIHRALWAPGVRNRIEAMHYIHELILEQLLAGGIPAAHRPEDTPPPGSPPLLVDLGCGVGASLAYLRGRVHASLAGITLSEVQADLARKRLTRDSDPESTGALVLAGDFMRAETLESVLHARGVEAISAAWMIESFVHAPDADALLRNVADHMRSGGVLMICDDLPTDDLAGSSQRPIYSRWIAEFRRGWHVQTWLSGGELARRASTAGFTLVDRKDLSSYVRTSPLRGMPVHLAAAAGRIIGATSPAWSNIRGGSALQNLSRTGLVRYQLLTFRRDR
ncbi:MAG: class I SAM-dependent methyltransferase [Spirochaetaceae bacterium]|nr:MAG: class I SAM-dependent methyltransferase [Spirochaetaceae bacterium]